MTAKLIQKGQLAWTITNQIMTNKIKQIKKNEMTNVVPICCESLFMTVLKCLFLWWKCWQSKYKSELLQTESYYLICILYSAGCKVFKDMHAACVVCNLNVWQHAFSVPLRMLPIKWVDTFLLWMRPEVRWRTTSLEGPSLFTHTQAEVFQKTVLLWII